MDNIFKAIVKQLSLPIWLAISVARNKLLRTIVILIPIVGFTLYTILGAELFLRALMMGFQLLFGFFFIAFQFIGLFWFLARTKVIETRPGDEGLVNFENDYFGNEHLVEIVRHWVKLITEKDELEAMGAEAIGGILLTGPPGTGKTLLARCLSTDSDAAFLGMSGSDFVSMFMGIGVLKVMQMFSKARNYAKEYGACILFVDEIDAIAGNRGQVQGGDTRSTVDKMVMGGMGGMGGLGVMSRLLVELDGIREVGLRDRIQNKMLGWLGMPPIDPGVVLVMSATNRPDALDPAIKRPGRMDKILEVALPDKGSRKLIIEGYLRKIKHDGVIDVDSIVKDTTWASPALLASAIQKDAPRLAIFDGRKAVSQRDIEMALLENALGLQQPITDFDPPQRRQVAIHEAGHAVAMYHLRPETRIGHVSIVKRSKALGFVLPAEQVDIYSMPISRFIKNIMVSIAGHEATKLVLGEYWTGAASDFENVRRQVNALYAYNAFNFPLAPMASGMGTVPPDTQKKVDAFLAECSEKTLKLLEEHIDQVERLTDALLERDDLSGAEVLEILDDVRKEPADE